MAEDAAHRVGLHDQGVGVLEEGGVPAVGQGEWLPAVVLAGKSRDEPPAQQAVPDAGHGVDVGFHLGGLADLEFIRL